MIIITNTDKLDKINHDLFKVVAISTTDVKDCWNMDMLLPPANILIERKNGNISKKKFKKEYMKFLSEKNSYIENTIYTLGMSIKEKNSLVFVCTKDEYKLGYLNIFGEYLNKVYGVEITKLSDGLDEVKSVIESLDMSKKEKKLLKTDDEELSEKKIKLKDKLLKYIMKEIKSEFSFDGSEYYDKLTKMYAIDQVVYKLTLDEVLKFDKSGSKLTNVNTEKMGKVSPIISAIEAVKESDKNLKKIIKSVLESHDISVKKLKKLEKTEICSILVEIYTNLTKYRSGQEE